PPGEMAAAYEVRQTNRSNHRRGAPVQFVLLETATAGIYPLSLHDALPISPRVAPPGAGGPRSAPGAASGGARGRSRTPARVRSRDRKSTRLNSSHLGISYAVFCLKKKIASEVLRLAP